MLHQGSHFQRTVIRRPTPQILKASARSGQATVYCGPPIPHKQWKRRCRIVNLSVCLCISAYIHTGAKEIKNPHQTSRDCSNLTRVVSVSSFARGKHSDYQTLQGTTEAMPGSSAHTVTAHLLISDKQVAARRCVKPCSHGRQASQVRPW